MDTAGNRKDEAISSASVHPAWQATETIVWKQRNCQHNHPSCWDKPPPKDAKKASDLKAEGNKCFAAKEFQKAIELYTEAIEINPESSDYTYSTAVFYSNRGASYMHLKQWDNAIQDCTLSLEKSPTYVKALMRRAQAFEAQDADAKKQIDPADSFNTEKYTTSRLEDAVKDLNEVLKIDPSFRPAIEMQRRLSNEIQQRQAQMKDEMVDKLKGFGNMFLNKFGMSCDDFKMQQDPNSGSYNMSYNPGT